MSVIASISKILSSVPRIAGDRLRIIADFGPISNRNHQRILASFSVRLRPTRIQQTEYLAGTQIKSIPSGTTGEIWRNRQSLWNQPAIKYGYTLEIIHETPIQPVPKFRSTQTISRVRHSFVLSGGIARLDLIMIEIDQASANPRTEFRLEVELLDPTKIVEWIPVLAQVQLQVLDTNLPYTPDEKKEVFLLINALLGSTTPSDSKLDFIPEATGLKLSDLQVPDFTVSYKVDGLRRYLVMFQSGIWLIGRDGETNRLSSANIPTLNGTILDGQLIDRMDRLEGAPTTPLWMLIYDCYASSGNASVRGQSYLDRMNFAQNAIAGLELPKITLNTKSFLGINSAPGFFETNRLMLDDRERQSFKTSGLIFRTGSKIFKWSESITADLYLRWRATPTGRVTELYGYDQGKLTIFPVSESGEVELLPTGTIVEYRLEGNQWKFSRLRPDRTTPNNLPIETNPVSIATLRGESFDLVAQYHRKIKQGLQTQSGSVITSFEPLPSITTGFVVVDQRLVEQMFRPPLTGTTIDTLEIGTRVLQYSNGQFRVDGAVYPMTKVAGQSRIRWTHRLEDAILLSEPEKIWTRLFISGVLNGGSTPTPVKFLPQLTIATNGDDTIDSIVAPAGMTGSWVRITTIGEPGNLFHAILKACYDRYQNSSNEAERRVMVRDIQAEIPMSVVEISRRLGMDIYVFSGLDHSTPLLDSTYQPGRVPEINILILQVGPMFETIGLDSISGIQTVWSGNSEVIAELRKKL